MQCRVPEIASSSRWSGGVRQVVRCIAVFNRNELRSSSGWPTWSRSVEPSGHRCGWTSLCSTRPCPALVVLDQGAVRPRDQGGAERRAGVISKSVRGAFTTSRSRHHGPAQFPFYLGRGESQVRCSRVTSALRASCSRCWLRRSSDHGPGRRVRVVSADRYPAPSPAGWISSVIDPAEGSGPTWPSPDPSQHLGFEKEVPKRVTVWALLPMTRFGSVRLCPGNVPFKVPLMIPSGSLQRYIFGTPCFSGRRMYLLAYPVRPLSCTHDVPILVLSTSLPPGGRWMYHFMAHQGYFRWALQSTHGGTSSGHPCRGHLRWTKKVPKAVRRLVSRVYMVVYRRCPFLGRMVDAKSVPGVCLDGTTTDHRRGVTHGEEGQC